MNTRLNARLDKIEQRTGSRGPLFSCFLKEGETTSGILDGMVAAGKITEHQRDRVAFVRWLTPAEWTAREQAAERGSMQHSA